MTRSGCFLGIGCAAALLASAAAAPAKPYKGAEVYSSQAYRYGRIEMRMRMVRGSGILSTFFLYKNGSELAGAFWEEVDIEVFGRNDATSWQSNIITGLTPRQTSEVNHVHPFSFAEGYHTFAVEWAPNSVRWSVDGVELRNTQGGQAAALTNPETLRFNVWSSESEAWVGAFDDSVLPQYQFVNWIRFYRYEGGAFVLDWVDEFDTFDTGRWGRGNWTFDGNRVDFDPANAVVSNGTLVLALTREGQTGFTGTVPVDPGGSTGGTSGTGGAPSTGGTPATGGADATGGLPTGGFSATGGFTATGGLATGGYNATGGFTTTGGLATGGFSATGGFTATGGLATGGVVATGGIPTTGGLSATGGFTASGGVVATGGATETGGTLATGSTPAAGGTLFTGGVPSSGGTMASGGSAGTTVPGPTYPASTTDDGGCSCSMGTSVPFAPGLGGVALGLAGLLGRRRRGRTESAAR